MTEPTARATPAITLAAIARLLADLAIIVIAIVLILSASGAVNLH